MYECQKLLRSVNVVVFTVRRGRQKQYTARFKFNCTNTEMYSKKSAAFKHYLSKVLDVLEA